MSASEKGEGIRGDELAEGATGASPPPEGKLAEGAVRGDGLVDGADVAKPAPDPDEAAEGGLRGDGLAKDA